MHTPGNICVHNYQDEPAYISLLSLLQAWASDAAMP